MLDPARTHLVGIVMGSDSDWPVMEAAARTLAEFGVPFEADVVSAHRMPDAMIELRPRGARPRPRGDHRWSRRCRPPARHAGRRHTIAGDRCPVALQYLDGMDSLLSIVQMPPGCPWPRLPSATPAMPACLPCASWPQVTFACGSGWSTSKISSGRPPRPRAPPSERPPGPTGRSSPSARTAPAGQHVRAAAT